MKYTNITGLFGDGNEKALRLERSCSSCNAVISIEHCSYCPFCGHKLAKLPSKIAIKQKYLLTNIEAVAREIDTANSEHSIK